MKNFDMKLAEKYSNEYRKASKKRKKEILDEYSKLTSTKRNTAVQRLKRCYGKNFLPSVLKIKKVEKRGRKKKYKQVHKDIIKKVWQLSGKLCAELMFSELENYLESLNNAGKLKDFTNSDIAMCKQVSLGTLKNIIREFPKSDKRNYKSKSHIYNIVPIDANFKRFVGQPGNFEVDYVEHNGGKSDGTFVITGTYVDLFSQWTVRGAALGKNLRSVTKIYEVTIQGIYHEIYRLHPDNCQATLKMLTERLSKDKGLERFMISRSRPYKKNDNAHVEQKNGDKVRKQIGYWRYETPRATKLLNEYYSLENLVSNFFIPCMKLHCKMKDERGSVVKKIYQKPATPYERLIRSRQVSKKVKDKLRNIKTELNLVELRERADKILEELGREKC